MTPSIIQQEHRSMSTEQPGRRRFSQGLIARSIVLSAFLALGTNPLYGQADDALFIDSKGNVGIGTRTPAFPLTCNDTVKIGGDPGKGLFLGESFGTARVTRNAYVDASGNWQIVGTGSGIQLTNDGIEFLAGESFQGQLKQLALFGKSGQITFNTRKTYIAGDLLVQGIPMYWSAGQFKSLIPGANPGPNPPSDKRLKTDLHPIPSALARVSQLRGVTFRWNEQGLHYLTKDIESTRSAGPGASDEENRKLWQAERAKRYKELSKTNVGVVAQDVEAVLPEAVTTDEAGYKQVAYHELIALRTGLPPGRGGTGYGCWGA